MLPDGKIVSFDHEMAFRAYTSYYPANGRVVGIYSCLFTRMEKQTVPDGVVGIFNSVTNENPIQITEDLFSVLKGEQPKSCSIISKWYECFARYTSRYGNIVGLAEFEKENLFWKMLQFYKHWKVIKETIATNTIDTPILLKDLLKKCNEKLFKHYEDNQGKEEAEIMSARAVNLHTKTERGLHRKLAEVFDEMIIENRDVFCLFKLYADDGTNSISLANVIVSDIYKYGIPNKVDKVPELAKKYIAAAANAGNCEAEYQFAISYEEEKNFEAALRARAKIN